MKRKEKILRVAIIFTLLTLILAGCVSKGDYEEVEKERDSLIKENKALEKELDTVKTELDEIVNGPSRLLSEAKKLWEEENYEKLIEVSSELHKKFTGVEEDIEGQELAKKAQEKIDEQARLKEEEEKRIAEEKAKTQKDKIREIIRVTKLSTGEPNSVGGVDLFIGYKNMSEKTIKYATFVIVPYNNVGDEAICDTRKHSTFSAEDQGPHAKGEGLAGDYNWYWKNAWYNWTIDRLELKRIDIEYMDGTKVSISGQDIEHVFY